MCLFVTSKAVWVFWVIETMVHHFAHIQTIVAHSHGDFIGDDNHSHDHSHNQISSTRENSGN